MHQVRVYLSGIALVERSQWFLKGKFPCGRRQKETGAKKARGGAKNSPLLSKLKENERVQTLVWEGNGRNVFKEQHAAAFPLGCFVPLEYKMCIGTIAPCLRSANARGCGSDAEAAPAVLSVALRAGVKLLELLDTSAPHVLPLDGLRLPHR